MRMYNKNVGINNFANQKQGGENMSKELFVRAEEVAGVLGISKPYAYKLVRASVPGIISWSMPRHFNSSTKFIE